MKNINLYLDISSSNTGICIEDTDKNTLTLTNINLQSLSKPPQMPLVDYHKIKLGIIKEEFDRLLKPYNIHSIYMEGIFIQPKFLKSSEILIKLHGFLIGYFMDKKVYYISPSEIKKAVTGKGNANKKDVIRCLEGFYGLSISDDNISDALAICVAHNGWKKYKDITILQKGGLS